MTLLEARDVTLRFGGVTALENVSLAVTQGEIFSIVGPNGAGKSSLINLVSRIHAPDRGDVLFDGASILARAPAEIAALGIARTFQNIELFERSTVLENLLIGRHIHRRTSFVSQILFTPAVLRDEVAHRRAVEEIVDFLELEAWRETTVSGLPYGTRKLVELGRALAVAPTLILLDEPASGLSPEETMDMRFRIEDIRRRMGVTVLMIEHDMGLVSAVSDRVLVLADGRVVTTGTPGDIQAHPGVREAFLGGREEHDP